MKFLSNIKDTRLEINGQVQGTYQSTASNLSSGASPAIYGMKAFTVMPDTAFSNITLNSQTAYCTKFEVQQAMTVTDIWMMCNTITTSPVASYTGFALYSDGATMNLIAATVDDTTLFSAATWRSKALPTPTLLTPGLYWATVTVRGTATQVRGSQTSSSLHMNGLPVGNTVGTLSSQTSAPSTITRSSLGSLSQRLMFGFN